MPGPKFNAATPNSPNRATSVHPSFPSGGWPTESRNARASGWSRPGRAAGAESTISTLPGSDQVRLTVHYKGDEPASVAIQLRLKDHKGSLSLERTTKHFGKKGVIHLTTKLGAAEMERALNAREFDVGLRAAGTPGYCSDMLEQHLSSKRSAGAHGARVYSAATHAAKQH